MADAKSERVVWGRRLPSLVRLTLTLLPGVAIVLSAEAGQSSLTPGSPPAPIPGADRPVSEPDQDSAALPTCRTQNEVALASWQNHAVAAWNDITQCELLVERMANPSTPGINFGGYAWSEDGGESWTDAGTIPLPPGESGGRGLFGDPALAVSADGVFYYASRAFDASDRSIVAVARSEDRGRTFLPPVDASPGRKGADKPWLAVDTTPTSPFFGVVYVAWTEEVPDPEVPGFSTWRVLFSRSTDGARSFDIPIELAHLVEAYGTQIAIGPQGEVYLAYLNSKKSLHFARSLDGGKSFHNPRRGAVEPNLKIRWGLPLGQTKDACAGTDGIRSQLVLNGDIRVLGWPSMAVDTSGSSNPLDADFNPFWGRIYIAVAADPNLTKQNPPQAVSPPTDDEADIFLLWSSDGGESWAPISADTGVAVTLDTTDPVNDDPGMNDQFHPQVAVDEEGRVALTWYDRRLSDDPTRANWEIDLFAAVSTDGGETVGPNVMVSDRSFLPSMTHPNTNLVSGCYMGEYNGLAATEDGFIAAWGDNRDVTARMPDPNVYSDRILLPPPAS